MDRRELNPTDLDSTGLRALLGNPDPLGVLSIFADAGTDARRTATEIHNRLAQLDSSLADEGPPQRSAAFRETVGRIRADLERLRVPGASGRGRVLFASLSGRPPLRLSTRLRLPNRVVLDDRPFIHPLLERSRRDARPASS